MKFRVTFCYLFISVLLERKVEAGPVDWMEETGGGSSGDTSSRNFTAFATFKAPTQAVDRVNLVLPTDSIKASRASSKANLFSYAGNTFQTSSKNMLASGKGGRKLVQKAFAKTDQSIPQWMESSSERNGFSQKNTPSNQYGNLPRRLVVRHLHEIGLQNEQLYKIAHPSPSNVYRITPSLISLLPDYKKNVSHLSRSSISSQSLSGKGAKKNQLPAHKRTSVQYSTLVGPSFVNMTSNSQLRALASQTAVMTCVIKNLHNHTVSWVRAKDINLLTADLNTYSSDTRFVASNPGSGPRWQLKIHHVKLSDAGVYLCQVSTTPPIFNNVLLTVTEASVSVDPGDQIFLKVGSPVLLICKVTGCPDPVLPMWYKGNKLLSNTVVKKEEGVSSTFTDTNETSSTEVKEKTDEDDRWKITSVIYEDDHATVGHSGVYSCTNTCTPPLNVTLHVLLDEETAAMQHINTANRAVPASLFCLLTITILAELHWPNLPMRVLFWHW